MKILCYGDSNTYGYDPCSFFGSRYPAEHRWVDRLAQERNCETINKGQNGREIPRRPQEFLEFERLLSENASVDLLIILLGTNDLLQGNSPEAVAARMEVFLNRIGLMKSRILLIAPPPMQHGEWVPDQAMIHASMALNQEYKTLSERLGVAFADAGEWNIPLTFDGVHFTEEGHRIFAERLSNYLNKGDKI